MPALETKLARKTEISWKRGRPIDVPISILGHADLPLRLGYGAAANFPAFTGGYAGHCAKLSHLL